MVVTITTIEIADGSLAKFLKHLREIEPSAQPAKGLLGVDFLIDRSSDQVGAEPRRSDVVTVIRTWEDLESAERSQTSLATISVLNKLQGMIRAATTRYLESVEAPNFQSQPSPWR